MPTQAELTIILEAQDRASAQLQAVGQQVQRLEQQVQQVGRGAAGGPGGLLGALLGGVSLATGMTAVNAVVSVATRAWDLLGDSIVGVNSRAEENAVAFRAFTGNAQQAGQMLEFLRREADRTTFPGGELIQAGQQLIPVVRGDQQAFEGLIHTAEVLAALRPQEGIVAATEALRRVSQGDLSIIQRQFGVSADVIQAYMARGASAFQAVDLALKQMGADQRLVEAMPRTLAGMVGAVEQFAERIRGQLGKGLFAEMEEGLRHAVEFVNRYGEQILAFAAQVGAAIGAVAGRLAGFVGGLAVNLLNLIAPGTGDRLKALFADAVPAAQELDQQTQAVAQSAEQLRHVFTLQEVQQGLAAADDSVERLNTLLAETSLPLQRNARDLAAIGLEAAGVQQQADRLNTAYEQQLWPLQRQQQLLQQNVTLQRLQSELAGVQAVQQGQRLELEIAALRTAAQGATDPNAPGLTARQRAIALALQERELQKQALDIQEQQRPEQESLQERVQAIQRAQADALKPLQDTLANYKDQVATLQQVRDTWGLLVQDIQAAVDQALVQQALKLQVDQAAVDKAIADSVKAGQDMAQQFNASLDHWLQEGGGTVWGAVNKSYYDWIDHGGREQLAAIGADIARIVGTAFGAVIGPAILAGVRAALGVTPGSDPARDWLTSRQPPPGAVGVPIPPGLPGGPPALPLIPAAGQPGLFTAQAGPTVNVEPGAVQVNGQPDPGLTDRLKQHVQDGLDAFGRLLAASSQTDLSSFQHLQGAPR